MLRYAHARAESLDVRVIFHQMSGTALKFPDGTFDLVVSNNLLHEIGRDNRRAMLREARRVARAGRHRDPPGRADPRRADAGRIKSSAAGTSDSTARFSGTPMPETICAADMRAAGFAPRRGRRDAHRENLAARAAGICSPARSRREHVRGTRRLV